MADEPVQPPPPADDAKKRLAAMPPGALEELIGFLQEILRDKQGKTWTEWFLSIDKTKAAGWVLFLLMSLLAWYQANKPTPTPVPVNPPAPIVKPLDQGPPNVPTVKPFGGQ